MIRRLSLLALTVVVGFLLLARGERPAAAAAGEGPVSGTVLSPSGDPVDGAEVIAATPALPAWPNLAPQERDEPRRGAATALTGKDGRFTITLPDDARLLSVSHPRFGYAEVKPDALGERSEPVKLEPWCRIEGVLKVGAKPAPAGTKVSLGVFYAVGNAARVHYGYDTTTDGQGRYVLDQVPAGVNQVKVKVSKTGSTLEQYVAAEPGKPARFDVGGRGRPVVGKVVLDGLDVKELSNPDPKARTLISQSHFRRDVPWPAPPYFAQAGTPEEREEILSTWRKSPEALAQWKDQYRFGVEFQPDGSYRFDDVPPGKYFLTLAIFQRGGGDAVAKQRLEVVVPEAPAVPTDEPLNIGEQRFEAKAAGTDGL